MCSKKENILILFGADSNLRWGRSFQLSKAFRSIGHNVMYIDGPKSFKITMQKVYNGDCQSNKVEGIDVFQPYFGLPYSKFNFLKKINRKNIYTQIKKHLAKNNFIPTVLWIYSPYDPVIGSLIKNIYNIKKVIYDCADDRVAYARVHRGIKAANKVDLLEKEVCEYCTSVITITEKLKQKREVLHSNIMVFPNGIDTEMFHVNKVINDNPYKNFLGKVVLNIGTIGDWIDQRLLIECANAYPELFFVCVGPWTTNVDVLQKKSNIYLIGKKDYCEVPHYIKYADLCIVPFRNNDITASCDSLKILQYIAMKKKILSTSYGNNNNYNGLVKVASSYKDFLQQINLMLNNNNFCDDSIRESVLNKYSWNNIAKKILLSI